MTARVLALGLVPLAVLTSPSGAGEWSAAKLRGLPDSAFAAVETTPEGRTARHLPHHDETGAVDVAHLRAARARLHQVKWRDPASEATARRHLEEHERALVGRCSQGL